MDYSKVRIINPLQAGTYVENGLNPLDIYWSIDKWVWVFDKEASQPLYLKWCKREL